MQLRIILAFLFALLLVSCSKDEDSQSEAFADESLQSISLETRSGPGGCYEILFPINIDLPDGTTLEAESFRDAKDQIKDWRQNNLDVQGRAQIAYPVELINDNGEIISADDRLELRRIIVACQRDGRGQARHCFEVVWPISIEFADNTQTEVNSRREAKLAVRQWRRDNPDSAAMPQIVWPITVEMEDGSQLSINSREELKTLKEDCE